MEVLSQDGARLARAWQDGVAALFDGYGEQLRRFGELGAGWAGAGMWNGGDLSRMVGRISEATRALGDAHAAVTAEWLRAPLWLTGAASPIDLQASYVSLLEANRELTSAYLEAMLGWQRAFTPGSERAADTVRDAGAAQTQTARRLANDAREVQQATVDATRSTVSAVRETTNRTITQSQG